MARVMYLECFAGAAGDMLLGALIDAGLPADVLRQALGSLGVGHELRVSRVMRAGIAATKVDVIEIEPGHDHGHSHAQESGHSHPHTHGHGHGHLHTHPTTTGESHSHSHHHAPDADGHRTVAQIVHLIEQSALSLAAKAKAVALYQRIAAAEAAIHNMPVEEVHLHEVGATDSIIDIVGVVFAMDWFGVEDVVASSMNVGGGTVEIAHGRFPVPAPATVRLLTGVPIYSAGPQVELVTPTGAVLVSGYATAYGPAPAMTIEAVGYGAGTRDFPRFPNVVRVLVGQRACGEARGVSETVVKIECEIDDMNPQLFSPVSESLFAQGALDVFLTAIQMKKGRPGTLVTVLAPEALREPLSDVLFRHTTTLGVRFERMSRHVLERRWVNVTVAGGTVRIKVAGRGSETFNAAPEFDDCLGIARATGRPVKDVQAEAMAAWLRDRPES